MKETDVPRYYGSDIDETKILQTHLVNLMEQYPTLEQSITLHLSSESLVLLLSVLKEFL